MIEQLFRFIEQSPTGFHAVDTIRRKLEKAGFTQLYEADEWSV